MTQPFDNRGRKLTQSFRRTEASSRQGDARRNSAEPRDRRIQICQSRGIGDGSSEHRAGQRHTVNDQGGVEEMARRQFDSDFVALVDRDTRGDMRVDTPALAVAAQQARAATLARLAARAAERRRNFDLGRRQGLFEINS